MSPATEKSSTAAGWYTLAQMRAWEKNPKKHPDSNVADIARSVRRFGFVAPVVVWGSRGQIVAGHGRYLAAQMILRADPGAYLATDAPGPALIPVRVVEFASDAEASAYALADNRLTEANPMEPVDVAAILKEIQDAGGDVEVPGWTEAEIAAMIGGQQEPDGTGGEDAGAEAPPAEPVSRAGEVYELGPHRLVCGDSADPNTWAMLMLGDRWSMMVTSPPYGQQRDYGVAKDHVRNWRGLMAGVSSAAFSCASDDGQGLVNLGLIHSDCAVDRYWDGWISDVESMGWRLFGWYVWDQGSGLPMTSERGRLMPSHEFIFHIQKERRPANKTTPKKTENVKVVTGSGLREKDGTKRKWASPMASLHTHKTPDSVLRVSREHTSVTHDHPAVFPVALPSELIPIWTDTGDIVAEPFGGSGTTLIACAKTGRIARVIEIDPRYCDVIRRRWTKYAISAGVDPGPGRLDA